MCVFKYFFIVIKVALFTEMYESQHASRAFDLQLLVLVLLEMVHVEEHVGCQFTSVGVHWNHLKTKSIYFIRISVFGETS